MTTFWGHEFVKSSIHWETWILIDLDTCCKRGKSTIPSWVLHTNWIGLERLLWWQKRQNLVKDEPLIILVDTGSFHDYRNDNLPKLPSLPPLPRLSPSPSLSFTVIPPPSWPGIQIRKPWWRYLVIATIIFIAINIITTGVIITISTTQELGEHSLPGKGGWSRKPMLSSDCDEDGDKHHRWNITFIEEWHSLVSEDFWMGLSS